MSDGDEAPLDIDDLAPKRFTQGSEDSAPGISANVGSFNPFEPQEEDDRKLTVAELSTPIKNDDLEVVAEDFMEDRYSVLHSATSNSMAGPPLAAALPLARKDFITAF